MAGGMGFLSLLAGGLKGYREGRDASDARDQQEQDQTQREAELKQRQDQFNYNKTQDAAAAARQQRMDDQAALGNADAALSGYQALWSRTNPSPDVVYGTARSLAKLHGYSDPDGYARATLSRFGLSASSGGSVSSAPPATALPPLTGRTATLAPAAPLNLRQSMTGSGDLSGVRLPPLGGLGGLSGRNGPSGQGDAIAPAVSSGRSMDAGAPSPAVQGDTYLQGLMAQMNSPYNQDPNGTMKAILDYEKDQADITDKGLTGRKTLSDIYGAYETDAGGIGNAAADPLGQNQAIDRINSNPAYADFPRLPRVGQKIGTQDVPVAGPPTRAMLTSGQTALPPLQTPFLQPLYQPDVKTGAGAARETAEARLANASASEKENSLPYAVPELRARIMKDLAEAGTDDAKQREILAGLPYIPAEKQASIRAAIARGDLDEAEASFKRAMQPIDVAKGRLSLVDTTNKQDQAWDQEKQRMLGTVATTAAQLSAMGVKQDKLGAYVVPPEGVQYQTVTYSPSTINALINKMQSAHLRAVRLDELMTSERNGLTRVVAGKGRLGEPVVNPRGSLPEADTKLMSLAGKIVPDDAAHQCGQWISDVGYGKSGIASRTISNKANLVQPDANGRVPDGSLAFWPKSGQTEQHFAKVYTGEDGRQYAIESTTAGAPKGKRVIRADEPISAISERHGRAPRFYLPPGTSENQRTTTFQGKAVSYRVRNNG